MSQVDLAVLAERGANAGLISLNRPQALNALTHAMVLEIHAALSAANADPAVQQIVLTSSSAVTGNATRQANDDVLLWSMEATSGLVGIGTVLILRLGHTIARSRE